MNKAALSKFLWKDIVIVKINDDDAILVILIFQDLKQGNKFVEEYLNVYPYEFIVTKNETTGRHTFTLNFLDSEYGIRFDSTKTSESYPPVTWLGQGIPTFISNGIWRETKNKKGREYIYNPEIIPIDDNMQSISLEDDIVKSFSKAIRIEFWPSTKPDEPEMVILVFEKRQGITAYNNLIDLVSIKSTYLKIEVGKMLTISFIDAVEDFHITIPNLKFDKAQLDAFKYSIGENHSFGFVLGLDHPEADRPMLLPTTPDFKIITVAGHI